MRARGRIAAEELANLKVIVHDVATYAFRRGAACIAGITLLVPRNTPVAFTSVIRFQLSSVCSANGTPAIFPI